MFPCDNLKAIEEGTSCSHPRKKQNKRPQKNPKNFASFTIKMMCVFPFSS